MEVNKDASHKPSHASRVVETVLWSDPQSKKGCVSNKKRGAGCRFGPDVAQEFMRREGIDLVRFVAHGDPGSTSSCPITLVMRTLMSAAHSLPRVCDGGCGLAFREFGYGTSCLYPLLRFQLWLEDSE